MKKMKPEANERRKDLSARMNELRLAAPDDEFAAEELYVVTGEYEALMADPANWTCA